MRKLDAAKPHHMTFANVEGRPPAQISAVNVEESFRRTATWAAKKEFPFGAELTVMDCVRRIRHRKAVMVCFPST